MLELVWASFVNVVAPVLGTVAGVVGLILLTKLLKSLGLTVDQKQLDALATAANQATKAVEAWAAKKIADGGQKPSAKEKAEKAVSMVKTFLSNNKLYDIAEDKIVAAIESKLGENAYDLDNIVQIIRDRKANQAQGGGPGN